MVRRFAILQGSGADLKPRVIDDAKESGLNSAYTCKGFARLRSRFFVGFLPRCTHGGGKEESRLVQVSRRVLEVALRSFGKTGLRCLDLTNAYKQILISSNSRSLMVLMVPKRGEKRQVFFTTASMPFGCAASVFSFNRITRSLLHLMQTLLGVIGGVFYDDFALLEGTRLHLLKDVSTFSVRNWTYTIIALGASDSGQQTRPFG